MEDERKVFDRIPEQFDRMRWRYTPEMFTALIDYAQVDERSRVLEIGPGTGQATEPLLKSGGVLAMASSPSEWRSTNPALADALDRVYDRHFVTETPYTHHGFRYENAANYGFADYHVLEFKSVREFDADGYVEYIGTHADHIGLVEPHRSAFFDGIRDAIEQHGGKLVMNLTDYLRLTRKP